MRKVFMVTALIISLLTFGVLGYVMGARDMSAYWSVRITKAATALQMGTYRTAWTNTRACVLAVDSAAMRLSVSPTAENLNDLTRRYRACEQHWKLLSDYVPDAESNSSVTRAYWEFTNWWGQIEAMVEIQIKMIVAQNRGDLETAHDLYDMLLEHRSASSRYRDRIETKLFEVW